MLTLARRWSLDCAQYTAPGGDAVPCVPSRARVFVAGLLAQAGAVKARTGRQDFNGVHDEFMSNIFAIVEVEICFMLIYVDIC